jgi:hypothetical protein
MRETQSAFRHHWRWGTLLLAALVPRLYLLRLFDIELSNDGFDAVNTLTILQTQGAAAIPHSLIDRFILHPLYMLLLYIWKLITPTAIDFYLSARFLSTLLACVAIILMFELARHADNEYAAWIAALLLAFAPTFLWESVAILSSTLFLALYLAVLLALVQARYRWASLLAFLAAITRYEGAVLLTLVFIALVWRDGRERKIHLDVWLTYLAFSLAVPLTLMGSGWLTTGNALEFLGAQSMASIWLRFFAPGDFLQRASFFITQYPALFPLPVVWLGIAGAVLALLGHRTRPVAILSRSQFGFVVRTCSALSGAQAPTTSQIRDLLILFLTSALYLLFFETLVWFNYTTLEVRFLMYPGLPLLIFAGLALASARQFLARWAALKLLRDLVLVGVLLVLLALSYQQGMAGMRFVYNMHASQRQVADELVPIIPPHQRTNVMIYGGISGPLDLFARQRGLQLAFTYFRFAPDDQPEQFLLDQKIQFLIYPVGNVFASAKYPYLARLATQTHGGVIFQPLRQFTTSLDNQLYSIWAVSSAAQK